MGKQNKPKIYSNVRYNFKLLNRIYAKIKCFKVALDWWIEAAQAHRCLSTGAGAAVRGLLGSEPCDLPLLRPLVSNMNEAARRFSLFTFLLCAQKNTKVATPVGGATLKGKQSG
ncbi:hypothetical protein HW555_006954 [Spodoptera exigua]|uniref:Uncharacterized protein n=1 Tax=Spodoptera exigua TaxID=7107 RepID=A0A835GGX4_SPOEX|nr:hypothetical protein HW555_006954 [Spodoptera exigua]